MAPLDFHYQRAKHDNPAREADQSVNDPCCPFGADGEIPETAVVPGPGPYHHPPSSGLQWSVSGADDVVTPKLIEQATVLLVGVPGIQMHGDSLWKKVREA
ncbi:hypothetical protein ACTXO0_03110 [Glutamicibacter ardleyensis]|uniref:hypothetical protein n=1 Tax=Glutamicibacter ardleyensis TaxID=225894 RepID=UPI003FD088A0